MKRLIGILMVIGWASFAHAQTGSVKTQSQLNTEIGTTGCVLPTCLYPDNTVGAITPFNLRQVSLDMVATLFVSGGSIASVSNSDGTLTISPTTGVVVASINLAHANTWTATQTINPAANSNNQALSITQTGSTSSAAGPINFNLLTVTEQGIATGSGLDAYGQHNTNVTAFRVNTNIANTVSEAAIGGSFGMQVTTTNSLSDQVALLATWYSNVNNASVAFSEAVNAAAIVGASGNASYLVAGEFDTITNGTVTNRWSVGINPSTSTTQGSGTDAAIALFDNGTSAGAYKKFILWTNVQGIHGIASTGDFFFADSAVTVSNIFNAANVTVSGNILNFKNAVLSGAGFLATSPTGVATLPSQLSGSVAQLSDGNNGASGIEVVSFGASLGAYFYGRQARGTQGSLAALGSGDTGVGLISNGYDGSAWANSGSFFTTTPSAWTTGNHETQWTLNVTPNGSTTQKQAGIIDSSGQWYLSAANVAIPSGPLLFVSSNTGAIPSTSLAGGSVAAFVSADGSSSKITMLAAGSSNTFGGINYFASRGTVASPTATQNSDIIGSNFAAGYGTSFQTNGGAGFVMLAAQTFTAANGGTALQVYTTPLNSVASVVAAVFDPSGGFSVGTSTDPGIGAILANTHLLAGTGTTPAISSCGTGSPSVSGGDNFGTVVAGTGVLTSCVINFGKTWGSAPRCSASSATAIASLTVTASTTQLTIGGTSLTGDTINWICGSTAMLEPANDNSSFAQTGRIA